MAPDKTKLVAGREEDAGFAVVGLEWRPLGLLSDVLEGANSGCANGDDATAFSPGARERFGSG